MFAKWLNYLMVQLKCKRSNWWQIIIRMVFFAKHYKVHHGDKIYFYFEYNKYLNVNKCIPFKPNSKKKQITRDYT